MGGKARRRALSAGLLEALEAIAGILEGHRGRACVIGGIGVIVRGVARLTRDVDVAVAGSGTDALHWVGELGRAGIVPRIADAEAFALESQVLLMRHSASGVEIDLSFASLPFELDAIAAAPVELLGAVSIPVARAEDLAIYKVLAWRPQDQQDLERLLALHGSAIDLARVRRIVAELSEALEADRSAGLEEVIRRVQGDEPP